jgi:hypothetical protein
LAARKLTDAESAVGAANPKVRATPRTCPVHAVLGGFYAFKARILKEITGLEVLFVKRPLPNH